MSKLVIIGAGPGGYVAALRAAQLGLDVTLVERDKLGGTCLHRGCIPSKALLHGAHVFETVKNSAKYGVKLPGEPQVDYPALAATKDQTVALLEKGVTFLLKKRNVTTLQGEAAFADAHTLSVRTADGQTQQVPFDHAIIATGGTPIELPGFPMDGQTYVTSNEVLRWTHLPMSLAIVGGGVIGCEFASCFARLGATVHLIELMDNVLPGFDEEVRREVARGLKKQGIELLMGVKVEEAGHGPTGATLTLSDGETLSVQNCVVAVGRGPVSDRLQLDKAGVSLTERGFVPVDERCRTGVPHIFAIGDVTGIAPLAHAASHMGIVAAEQIAGQENGGRDLTFDKRTVPWGVFCKPEVGFIGLTEEKAREGGREVKIGKFQFRGLGKSQAIGDIDGFVKIIADEKSGELLGIHIVGPEATDLLGEASVAFATEADLESLAETVHCHPTLSEAIGEAALAALGRPIHGV